MKPFFKNVVVAVSGRQSSIHAAMYAIMMAKSYNLNLKFVYVVDVATIKYLSMNKLLITNEQNEIENKLREDGDHYLDYVEMLSISKGVKCQKELREGSVFREILDSAEEFDADLILLGGNEKEVNKKGVKNFAMTATENEVLANSLCPVMIVQKPNIEKLFKIF